MKFTIHSLGLLCLSFVSLMGQGVCSEQTTRGTYGLACEGHLIPGPTASLTPVKILGTCKQNSAGQVTCATTLSLGGTIFNQHVAGQVTMQPDCTGETNLKQTLNGQPAPDLRLRFFVLDGGKQMKAMAVDPGTVLRCDKDRMSVSY